MFLEGPYPHSLNVQTKNRHWCTWQRSFFGKSVKHTFLKRGISAVPGQTTPLSPLPNPVRDRRLVQGGEFLILLIYTCLPVAESFNQEVSIPAFGLSAFYCCGAERSEAARSGARSSFNRQRDAQRRGHAALSAPKQEVKLFTSKTEG